MSRSRRSLAIRTRPQVAALALTLVGLLVPAALAQPVEEDEPAMAQVVHLVELPGATSMAVHDELGVLVVGHTVEGAARLSLFTLDGSGEPVELADGAQPTVIDLPRPDSLAGHDQVALALTFHPELPLLYVWQDVQGIEDDSDSATVTHEQFDHLVIYQVEGNTLTETQAHGRGADYAYNQVLGSLTVSGDGHRLFIPNLRGTEEGSDGAVGYFDLDAEGMPLPVPVPIEGTLDGRGINEFDMQIKPHVIYTGANRGGPPSHRYIKPLPTGTGFFAPNQRVLVFGSRNGFGVWDTEDRGQALSDVTIIIAGIGYSQIGTFVVGHPELPKIYGVQGHGSGVVGIQHAHGFPTLLPDTAQMPGASFISLPVVFHGVHHGMAVGGENHVYLIGLDEAGGLTEQFHSMEVAGGGSLRALVYSPKHDRVYIAVNEKP